MLLETDQVSFTLGGIPFGQVDEFGVDWSIEQLEGWTGSTRSTSEITQKPRQSGGWRSTGYSGARSISASGKIYAPDAASLSAAFDRLNAAIPAGVDRQFAVTDAAGTRWVNVQQSDDVLTNWLMTNIGTWSIQVEATDWRKFGESLSGSTKLPSTTGGLTVSFTVPFSINATTVTGQVSLTNTGNESGTVVLRIDGPCTGPIVTHQPSGRVLAFSSSLALQAGEYLLIDMDARTALANGQANRAGYITSRGWSSFRPGANTWSFTAAQYNASSQLTVTAVPAWR
ncbi:phage distal tail protein [Curtobacterium sp. USHLN213]|uniref:phage distal tail protein n=1 Tax=Curtobacterium sp. USHLN213 TaxID=3081255 RepID=UPI003015E0B4